MATRSLLIFNAATKRWEPLGDTDALAAGLATLDMGGLTGARTFALPDDSGTLALTPSVVVTATSVTASAGQHIHVTAAGQTITLPSSAVAGDSVTVSVENFYDTVIARNGLNIMGLAENITIDQANIKLDFTYISATKGWWI